MKTILLFLIGCAVSVSAQIEKDWTVKIPDVITTPNGLNAIRNEIIIGHSDAVLIDFSRINKNDLDGDGVADSVTRWVWISSKGVIIHRAINND